MTFPIVEPFELRTGEVAVRITWPTPRVVKYTDAKTSIFDAMNSATAAIADPGYAEKFLRDKPPATR